MHFADTPLTTVRVYSTPEAGFDASLFFNKLDKHGGVDEVWLSTLEGNAAIPDHKIHIEENLKPLAAGLRKRNIIVSIQLNSCIGHFGSPRVQGGFPWTKDDLLTDATGLTIDGICCPSSEKFTAWTADILAMYCKELDIHTAYLDDDVRLFSHAQILRGCFCPRCLAQFAEFSGRKWEREELGELLAGKEVTPVRTQWVNFHTQQIAGFCGAISAKVHEASPDTIMGLQNMHAYAFHDCWNFAPVFKAMSEASGKPARVRVGGGVWNDFAPTDFIRKSFIDSCDCDDAAECGHVDMITCEIENYPCTATNKSAYTFGLQGALSLAFGMTSTTFQSGSLWFSGSNVMDDFFYQIARWRNIYEILSHGSAKYKKDGLNLAVAEGFINEPKPKEGFDNYWYVLSMIGADNFLYTGFPVLFSKKRVRDGFGGSYLTRHFSLGMDKDTLAGLLKNGLLLSGDAFVELAGRGLMDFTGVKADNCGTTLITHTDDPLNGPYAGKNSACTSLESPCVCFDAAGSGARILAKYRQSEPGKDVAAWALEGSWGRLAVVGYPGEFTRSLHSAELELFRNLFDWVHGRPLAVRALGFETLTIVPAIDSNNACRLVSVLNNGIAPRHDVSLEIRSPAGKKFFWNLPGMAPSRLMATNSGGNVKVVIPSLNPWEFGVITME